MPMSEVGASSLSRRRRTPQLWPRGTRTQRESRAWLSEQRKAAARGTFFAAYTTAHTSRGAESLAAEPCFETRGSLRANGASALSASRSGVVRGGLSVRRPWRRRLAKDGQFLVQRYRALFSLPRSFCSTAINSNSGISCDRSPCSIRRPCGSRSRDQPVKRPLKVAREHFFVTLSGARREFKTKHHNNSAIIRAALAAPSVSTGL